MSNSNNSKKKAFKHSNRVVTKNSALVQVRVPFKQRLKTLTYPNRSMSPNDIFLAQLVRGMEVARGYSNVSEKAIEDSVYARSFIGKRPVFVGDVVDVELGASPSLTLLNLTIVGEDIGGVITPVRLENNGTNLVASKFKLDAFELDFSSVTKGLVGKIFRGTTLMFSAVLGEFGPIFTLKGTRVLDYGLRMYESESLSSGVSATTAPSVDTLAVLTSALPTHNFEYFTVESGVLVENNYRNRAVDSYVESFKEDYSESHLLDGIGYILRTYDTMYQSTVAKAVGIAEVVPTEEG